MKGATSRPLAWAALAYALGVWAGGAFTLWPAWIAFALWAMTAISGLISRRLRRVCVFLAALGLGVMSVLAARSFSSDQVVSLMPSLRGQRIHLEGFIVSDPDLRQGALADKNAFLMKVRGLSVGAQRRRARGLVLVHDFSLAPLAYGDHIESEGVLAPPFEDHRAERTSYRAYLERRGIQMIFHIKKKTRVLVLGRGGGISIEALAGHARRTAAGVFARYFSPVEAGLINALVLGDQSRIPAGVREAFTRTGTAHILAVSGFNVGLVVCVLVAGFKTLPVPRRMRLVLIMAAALFYALMTGAGGPVVRAAVMAAVILMALAVERDTDVLNTLGLAALVILVGSPLMLFDIGLQLSFACVLGMVVMTPFWLDPLKKAGWQKRPVAFFCLEAFAVSLAAWLGSAGLVAYYFAHVTPVGLLVNIPLVPLVALMTVLGFLLVATAWCIPLAWCVAVCLKALLIASTWMVAGFAHIPGGWWHTPQVSPWIVGTYYALLLLAVAAAHWHGRRNREIVPEQGQVSLWSSGP